VDGVLVFVREHKKKKGKIGECYTEITIIVIFKDLKEEGTVLTIPVLFA